MYEYRSNEKKTFEAIVAALLLLFSTATLGASGFFEPPVSLLLRLLGAVGILATAWVTVNTLGKSYVYRIAPSDRDGASLDFTVTERIGTRTRTVCRIAVCDVEKVLTRREARLEQKTNGSSRPVFCYMGRFFSREEYCLVIRDDDGEALVRICSDARLVSLLKNENSNFCL